MAKSRLPNDIRVTPPPRPEKSGDVSVVDIDKLHLSISKIASAVNRSARHTEQIPEIKRKVEGTSEKVIKLDTKMEHVTERVEKIENKVDEGHECSQIDVIAEIKTDQRDSSQKIEADVQRGIKRSGEIAFLKKETAEIESNVEDIKKAPRRMFYGLIGVIITILTGSGGAVWFLAQLEADVSHEREQRVDQFNRIETQIKSIAKTSNPAPVIRQVQKLERTVDRSTDREEEYNTLCADMPRHEKGVFVKVLRRRGRRIPRSCLE